MVTVKGVTFGEGRVKLAVPLTARSQEELVKQADQAAHSAAQVVEWRADYYEDVLLEDKLIETLTLIRMELGEKILLFTFRTKEEGGEQELSLKQYERLCTVIAESQRVDMIDLELTRVEFLGRGFMQKIKAGHVTTIISTHHFDQTPPDGQLMFQIGMMNQFGADIGKIATMPHSLQDVLRIMNIIQRAKGINHLPLAVMAMGDLGKVTRVGGELIGSVLSFGSLNQASAPGQIPIETMNTFIEAMAIEQIEIEGD